MSEQQLRDALRQFAGTNEGDWCASIDLSSDSEDIPKLAAALASTPVQQGEAFDARAEVDKLDGECSIYYDTELAKHLKYGYEQRAAMLQRFLERAFAAGQAAPVQQAGARLSEEQVGSCLLSPVDVAEITKRLNALLAAPSIAQPIAEPPAEPNVLFEKYREDVNKAVVKLSAAMGHPAMLFDMNRPMELAVIEFAAERLAAEHREKAPAGAGDAPTAGERQLRESEGKS